MPKIQGLNMRKSLYEKDCIDIAKSILKISETNNCKIILPLDLVVCEKFETNAKFEIVSSDAVPSEMMALDIGPKTINKISSVFQKVNFFKPKSIRKESKETYLHCKILKSL